MKKGDRYRLVIIVSYLILVVCTLLLAASLWNHLSLNPHVYIGNSLYLLLFLILTLATVIFILHLMVERNLLPLAEDQPEKEEEAEPSRSGTRNIEQPAPYEVEIDEIAAEVIPPADRKESLESYAEKILLNLAKQFRFVQGVLYIRNEKTRYFECICTYAYTATKAPEPFREGEGLVGQAVKNKRLMNLTSLPEGYLVVQSGLGRLLPDNLVIIPLLLNREIIGVIELASFHPLDGQLEWTLRNLARIIGNSLVTKIKSIQKK